MSGHLNTHLYENADEESDEEEEEEEEEEEVEEGGEREEDVVIDNVGKFSIQVEKGETVFSRYLTSQDSCHGSKEHSEGAGVVDQPHAVFVRPSRMKIFQVRPLQSRLSEGLASRPAVRPGFFWTFLWLLRIVDLPEI